MRQYWQRRWHVKAQLCRHVHYYKSILSFFMKQTTKTFCRLWINMSTIFFFTFKYITCRIYTIVVMLSPISSVSQAYECFEGGWYTQGFAMAVCLFYYIYWSINWLTMCFNLQFMKTVINLNQCQKHLCVISVLWDKDLKSKKLTDISI